MPTMETKIRIAIISDKGNIDRWSVAVLGSIYSRDHLQPVSPRTTM